MNLNGKISINLFIEEYNQAAMIFLNFSNDEIIFLKSINENIFI